MITLGNQPVMAREPHRSLFYMHLVDLGLDNLWNAIVAQNRAANLAYHNTEHLFGVAHISRDIAMAEGVASNSSVMKMIITIGLIHDVNHAGSGRNPDAKNIERSIQWFEEYVADLEVGSKESDFFLTFGERIKETIKVTEFPFVHTPVNKFEGIVRDADILWSYQQEATRIVNHDLHKEVSDGKGAPVPFGEWVRYNVEFYHKSRFFTATARKVAEHLRAGLVELVKINPQA